MLPNLPMRSRYLLDWLDIHGMLMYFISGLSEKAVFE